MPDMGRLSLGYPTCPSLCHPRASPYVQSESFFHAMRWKEKHILQLFPLVPGFCLLPVSTQSKERVRENWAWVEVTFKGHFTAAGLLCHEQLLVTHYKLLFSCLLATWYQNSLPATEGTCLLLVHNQRKKEVARLLGLLHGHFPKESLATGAL